MVEDATREVVELSSRGRIVRVYGADGSLLGIRREPLTIGPGPDTPPFSKTELPVAAAKAAPPPKQAAPAPQESAADKKAHLAALKAQREALKREQEAAAARPEPEPEPAPVVAPEPEPEPVAEPVVAAPEPKRFRVIRSEPVPEPVPEPVAEPEPPEPEPVAAPEAAPEPVIEPEPAPPEPEVLVVEESPAEPPAESSEPAVLVAEAEEAPKKAGWRARIVRRKKDEPVPEAAKDDEPEAASKPRWALFGRRKKAEPEAEPASKIEEAPAIEETLLEAAEPEREPELQATETAIEVDEVELEEIQPEPEPVVSAPRPPRRASEEVPDVDDRVDLLLAAHAAEAKRKKRAPLPVPEFSPIESDETQRKVDAILRAR